MTKRRRKETQTQIEREKRFIFLVKRKKKSNSNLMDQAVSGRNIGGIKQTQISGLLCKYTNVVKGWCVYMFSYSFSIASKHSFNDDKL